MVKYHYFVKSYNKPFFVCICLILSLSASVFSQAPSGFQYQAVARDANGLILSSKIISMKISILANSASGSVVYSEKHDLATNNFGLVELVIGKGNVLSGNFSLINWNSGSYFLKTEIDITGGTNYVFLGTTQFLSVPFSLYSDISGKSLNDNDTSSSNELQILSLKNDTLYLTKGNYIYMGRYLDNTDTQRLYLSGTYLSIGGGNSVKLNGVVDLDDDPTNELQNLSVNGNELKISKTNSVIIDADTANEIQNLNYMNDTLSISQSNYVIIHKEDTLNEIQFLRMSHDTMFLSKGNFAKINLDNIYPPGTCIYTNSITPPLGFSFVYNYSLSTNRAISLYSQLIPRRRSDYYFYINSKLYNISNRDTNTNCDKGNTEFILSSKTWSNKSLLFTNREGCHTAILNNKFYFIGGIYCSTQNVTKITEVYDPSSDSWTVLSPLNNFHGQSSWGSNLIECNGKLYLIGGDSAYNILNIVEEYDPINNLWRNKANISFPRHAMNSCVYNNKIYVFGGYYNPGGQVVNRTDEFNPITNKWTQKTNIPIRINYCNSILHNNKIYLFGGRDSANHLNSKVFIYDPINDSWTQIASILDNSPDVKSACIFNNTLFLIGNFGLIQYDTLNNSWLHPDINNVTSFDFSFKAYSFIYNNKLYISSDTKIFEFDPTRKSVQYYMHCKN